MKRQVLTLALAALATSPVIAQEAETPAALGPSDYVNGAEIGEWVQIDASDLLVMDLTPDRDGKTRRVIIQLMPEPFSQGWVRNIRKLAATKWWDGTSVNRVQDNYVVQWGDASEEKVLPEGLETVPESGYREKLSDIETLDLGAEVALPIEEDEPFPKKLPTRPFTEMDAMEESFHTWDNIHWSGWPITTDYYSAWPVHCYGAVGVGRGYSPDTGSGAELYTVIGHAPRHLDRNIAVVGRVIEGIEHLSSLPRGTGSLGFYESAEERVPIESIRLASALEADNQPRFEYLSTESEAFAKYADARANRRDPFFITPAGGADICNIPVPVRRVEGE